MKEKSQKLYSFFKNSTTFIWNITKVIIAFFSCFCLIPAFEAFLNSNIDPLYKMPSGTFLKASLLLTFLLLLLPQNKIRNYCFVFFYSALFIFNFIQIEHLILFGTKLSYSSSLTLLNTDPRMVTEFVRHFFGIKPFLALLVCLIPYIWVSVINIPYQIHIKLTGVSKKDVSFILPICLFLIYILYSFVQTHIKDFPFYDAAFVASYKDLKDFEKRIDKMKEFELPEISVPSFKYPQLHVVVLGESARRKEMSLYGNVIQTTPFADSIKDNLYIFDNVTSWSAQTAPMMEKLLTLSENETDRYKMWEEPSIIDFYNAAGFETFWISGHSMYGLFDNYSHLLKRVKHKTFINKHKNWNEGFKKHKYDAELLPAIEKALAYPAQKKVIFIHLMGSHIRYSDRYPKEYQSRNPEFKILENNANPRYIEYIKSIHYSDWMLSEIFKRVQKEKESSSFILYFSDHAEGVSLLNACFCHADSKKDYEQLEVPFFLWLSDSYKKENASYVASFKDYLHRPYETNNWIHSILDLSRIKHPKLDPSKSLFNPAYKAPAKRRYEEWLELKSK